MSDLLEVLKAEKNVEGKTTSELCQEMGWPETVFYKTKLRSKLRTELAAGRVEVANAVRVRIDGRPAMVPVYRLKV